MQNAHFANALQRGRRAEPRLRLRLAARMILLDGTQHCTLTDLSTGGARVQPSNRVRRDADVVLMWGSGLEAFGKIIWTGEHDCGILFDEPLVSSALQATRQIDEVDRLPEGRDMLRQSARAFVCNGTRF